MKKGDYVRLKNHGGWVWDFDDFKLMSADRQDIRFNWDTVYGVVHSVKESYVLLSLFRQDGVQISLTAWDNNHPIWGFYVWDLVKLDREIPLPSLEES